MPGSAILVTDDDQGHRTTLVTILSDWGYRVDGAESGEAAVAACGGTRYAVVLMDMRMPGMDGVEAMKKIHARDPALPVLIMTAYSDVETAVGALKAGAYDYLAKPLDFDELKITLARVVEHGALKEENAALRSALAAGPEPMTLLGRSPAVRRLAEMIDTVAPSEATVLVTGESGTGKELAAKMIHAKSGRRGGPYITVNCAALSENLLESELFGHEKGAFTGADRRRDGRFYAANKGTIFLDEIGEIPLPMQSKLLRAIQEREIQRVGGDRAIKVDVRIVAATNRNLEDEVAAGRFRADLYYRLNVVTLRMPPLRERPDDVPVLAAHFLRVFAARNGKLVKGIAPGAMDLMLRYPWPGNVRELENIVERAVVLSAGEYLGERDLPPGILACGGPERPQRFDFSGMTLEEIERAAVREALDGAGGNKSEAARRLGITRKTLLTKLQGE